MTSKAIWNSNRKRDDYGCCEIIIEQITFDVDTLYGSNLERHKFCFLDEFNHRYLKSFPLEQPMLLYRCRLYLYTYKQRYDVISV